VCFRQQRAHLLFPSITRAREREDLPCNVARSWPASRRDASAATHRVLSVTPCNSSPASCEHRAHRRQRPWDEQGMGRRILKGRANHSGAGGVRTAGVARESRRRSGTRRGSWRGCTESARALQLNPRRLAAFSDGGSRNTDDGVGPNRVTGCLAGWPTSPEVEARSLRAHPPTPARSTALIRIRRGAAHPARPCLATRV
jgi:hypothetical protein